MESRNRILKAFLTAFPYTIPIFAGFWFLGLTYGILMNVHGFSFWYPMLISMTVFAGSMEFVAVSLLLGAFDPLQAFCLTLMVNARHLFYGISMLDKYRGMGWKKPFLIFWMCDETFSINYTVRVPEGVDRGLVLLFISILNYCYWVSGATLGGIFGSFVTFSTKGLSFVMTAMFVVIFMEQWLREDQHMGSLAGLGICTLCLLVFGAQQFIIPSMAGILLVLTWMRQRVERRSLQS